MGIDVCYSSRQSPFCSFCRFICHQRRKAIVSSPSLSNIAPPAHKTDGIYEELKDVQRKLGYLPAAELERIAHDRDLYLRDVHAIVSYYPHFRLQRPAKVEVRVCD